MRASIASLMRSWTSSSSPCPDPSSSTVALSAFDIAEAVLPPWLEWASSMMMAKRRSRCLSPISARTNGNFWTVVMMIFLPTFDHLPQVRGVLGVSDGGAHLGELLDRVADLAVEDATVRDHDDRVEHLLRRVARLVDVDELVGGPGDRVRLAAAGGVLDQVAPPGAVGSCVGEELAGDVELVEPREDLLDRLLAGVVVGFLDDLGVCLDDVGEAQRSEDLLPEVGGLEPVRIRRVPGPVVEPAVERQEPRRLASELRAELDLSVVDGEVRKGALEPEDELLRVPVALVLLDGVGDGLLRQAVLQLERADRKPVDEQGDVEGELGLVLGVVELAGDGEAVLGEQGLGRRCCPSTVSRRTA